MPYRISSPAKPGYEWLEQRKNPITLVRQSTQGKRIPEVLEPNEIQNLYRNLTTGLRRSELLALKWADIDFSNLTMNVVRSIYQRAIGNCKTEASRKAVPLAAHVAADLWLWKERSLDREPNDWVFASPHMKGEYPFWRTSCWPKSFDRQRCEPGSKK